MPIDSRLLLEPNRPAHTLLVANLDCSRIALRFLHQKFRDFLRTALKLEIDCFHESVQTLPLVGFREARDGAAQGRDRSRFVVAVLSAEPSRRQEESSRLRNLLVEHAHRGVKRFDSYAHSFVPGGEIHIAEIAFIIESGEPAHAIDWAARDPIRESSRQRLDIRAVVEAQDLRSFCPQQARQCIRNSALIRHDDHAAPGGKRDVRRLAFGQRRAQDGQRHPSRNPIGGLQTGRNWARFLAGCLDHRRGGRRRWC